MQTHTLLSGIALGCSMLILADAVAAQNWQMRRLMHPTQLEMQREIRGGVFIYDGLHSRQIETALDANFERMQNMMFIRTRAGSGDSEVVVDDGC